MMVTLSCFYHFAPARHVIQHEKKITKYNDSWSIPKILIHDQYQV